MTNTPSTTTLSSAAAAIATASGLISALGAAAKGGLTTSITTLLQDLDADTIGFVGQEAEDFDNLLDNYVEGIEAGQISSASWSAALATFVSAEKSQLWAEWTGVLTQFALVFDSWVKAIEAVV